jgi:hypothetical protein
MSDLPRLAPRDEGYRGTPAKSSDRKLDGWDPLGSSSRRGLVAVRYGRARATQAQPALAEEILPAEAPVKPNLASAGGAGGWKDRPARRSRLDEHLPAGRQAGSGIGRSSKTGLV